MSRNLGFLTTFAYYGQVDMAGLRARNPTPFWMGDSGAFSALYSGSPVTIDEYDEWLLKWNGTLDASPCFDVIGDPEATRVNLDRQVADGLRPMPVWHFGSPIEALWRLMDDGFGYIALGNMLAVNSKMYAKLHQMFDRAAEYGACFHLFGSTNRHLLRAFPFYSADSSSWDSFSRWGLIHYFDPARRHVRKFKRTDHARLIKEWDLITDHGIDPAMLETVHWKDVLVPVGMRPFARWADSLAKTHGPIKNREVPQADGPFIVLAVVGQDHFPDHEVTLR